ncbi:hypothetical protein VNO80_03030 [Phaseolus coccineus]|uniref:FLZ-type domain-containing protein n=1 Tax=Phaseolus coccineus TaxID=3886 RepID=A0AAN9NV95_PHACN
MLSQLRHCHWSLNAAASNAANQQRSSDSGGALTPKIIKRYSSDLVDRSHFLRVCALCKGRLAPGRDIYMYRGDNAFCSLKCRQHQMNQDERKEKFVTASKKLGDCDLTKNGQSLSNCPGQGVILANFARTSVSLSSKESGTEVWWMNHDPVIRA